MNTHFNPSLLNPREAIGSNNPPTPIDYAQDTTKALSDFLLDHPVIQTEAEARDAKLHLDRAKGKRTVTNTFTVPALGILRTNGYLTAGNQYPLAPPAENINQFNGDMTKAVYCAGSPAAVSTCLTAQLPSR